MWRLLGLTLVFVAGAATAANAASRSERPATSGIAGAVQQSAAVAGARPRALNVGAGLAQLQFGGALAFAQPSLRAAVAAGRLGGPRSGDPIVAPGRVRPLARRSGLARWLDLDGSEPALAYPVTETLSLGLGYRFLRSEDLVFKVAKTGSLDSDYQSHNLLLQAHWEF
jgi:hypothetical protein